MDDRSTDASVGLVICGPANRLCSASRRRNARTQPIALLVQLTKYRTPDPSIVVRCQIAGNKLRMLRRHLHMLRRYRLRCGACRTRDQGVVLYGHSLCAVGILRAVRRMLGGRGVLGRSQ
jgi:hypothetical protein